MDMFAMTVESLDISVHSTGIIKRITRQKLSAPNILRKLLSSPSRLPAYHYSSASQLSLTGFLQIVLSAQYNVIRTIVKSRPDLFVTAMMWLDTVAGQEYGILRVCKLRIGIGTYL